MTGFNLTALTKAMDKIHDPNKKGICKKCGVSVKNDHDQRTIK